MKKAIVGLVAIGVVIGLRPLARRKMREHCQQMAAKCTQMMAARAGDRGEAVGMREHCEEMIGKPDAHGELRKPAERVAV